MAQLSLRYYTCYNAFGTFELKEGRGRNTACFAEAFRYFNNYCNSKTVVDETYDIKIFKASGNSEYRTKGNATFLNKRELTLFINAVKNIFPFKCSIKETDDDFTVTVSLTQPQVCHKFLLTWIRYTYEYPYNVASLHAVAMRQTKKYDYINMINLVHTIMPFLGIVGAHSIIGGMRDNIFCSYAKLKKQMKGLTRIDEIYKKKKTFYPSHNYPSMSLSREEQILANKSIRKWVSYYKKCKEK